MQRIKIEWKHFNKDGKTCHRCSQTGKNLIKVLEKLKAEFTSRNIQIELKETKLPENRMAESNQILINGQLIENLIINAKAGRNCCDSCTDLIDNSKGCNCRTINRGETIHEEIPVKLIKEAIINFLPNDRKEGK